MSLLPHLRPSGHLCVPVRSLPLQSGSRCPYAYLPYSTRGLPFPLDSSSTPPRLLPFSRHRGRERSRTGSEVRKGPSKGEGRRGTGVYVDGGRDSIVVFPARVTESGH